MSDDKSSEQTGAAKRVGELIADFDKGLISKPDAIRVRDRAAKAVKDYDGVALVLIFSVGSKRLIEDAVSSFGNDEQRAVWRSWVATHPEMGPMPKDFQEIALSSLRQMYSEMLSRLAIGLPEDDAADLSNDIADVNSVIRHIETLPPIADSRSATKPRNDP